MPIDFSEFEEFNTEKIKSWESLQYTDQDIQRWKEKGIFVDKLYEFKMKKLFLEYLKLKLEEEICVSGHFPDYDPVAEAERILRQSPPEPPKKAEK